MYGPDHFLFAAPEPSKQAVHVRKGNRICVKQKPYMYGFETVDVRVETVHARFETVRVLFFRYMFGFRPYMYDMYGFCFT